MMKTLTYMALAAMGLLLAVWLAGCDGGAAKDEGKDAARTPSAEQGEYDAHEEHAAHSHHEGHQNGQPHEAADAHGDAHAQEAADIEQKTCPVMGDPIDPDVFAEYEGRKVYFCCEDCVKKFKANPEKYLAKLNQKDK